MVSQRLEVPYWLKILYMLENNQGCSKAKIRKNIGCFYNTACDNINLMEKIGIIKSNKNKNKRSYTVYLNCNKYEAIDKIMNMEDIK